MILDLQKRLHGREDELSNLLSRVRTLDRSVTLVTGDSGIGKTALLQELRDRIRDSAPLGKSDFPEDWLKHDIAVGYFECQRSMSQDPLLHAAQDLLETLVSDGERLSEGVVGKAKLFLSSIQDPKVVLGTLRKMANSLSLQVPVGEAKISVSVKQALDPLFELAGSGSSVPEEFVKILAPGVFVHLMALLEITFPGKRRLLILDNLSAVVEGSLGKLKGNVLLDVCDGRFLDCKGVHLILGWKMTTELTKDLVDLRTALRTYSTSNSFEEVKLPLTPTEAIEEWLRNFDWFREAEGKQQKSLVKASGGLPLVVEQWIRRASEDANNGAPWHPIPMELAEQIAKQVAADRFESYRIPLENSPNRELMFQLAISPQPLHLCFLELLTGTKGQEIKDCLKPWVDSGLLRFQEENRGVWEFKHERKQEFALSILQGQLVDKGRESADQLVRCFLENAGFFSDKHPDADNYLGSALLVTIATESKHWDRDLLTVLVSTIDSAGTYPAPSAEALQALPPATRFLAFHGAPAWRLEIPELEGLDVVNAAKGLVNASNSYGNAQDLTSIAHVLVKLEGLSQGHAANAEVVKGFAHGLVNASNAYGKAHDWPSLADVLRKLEALKRRYISNVEVVVAFAMGLTNASKYYGNAQLRDSLKDVLGKLDVLSQEYAPNAEVAEEFAKGLVNASMGYVSVLDLHSLTEVLEKLERLAKLHGGNTELLVILANGLYNASNAYGSTQDWSSLKNVLRNLEGLAHSHAAINRVVVVFAKGLVNASVAYGKARNWASMTTTLGKLEELANGCAANAEVVTELVKGLVNASIFYSGEQDWDSLTDVLEKLRATRKRIGTDVPPQVEALFSKLDSLPLIAD